MSKHTRIPHSISSECNPLNVGVSEITSGSSECNPCQRRAQAEVDSCCRGLRGHVGVTFPLLLPTPPSSAALTSRSARRTGPETADGALH
ncbi:hypothetical protein EYF80_052221 [Liparis tanakae]|uniref:Uncharacterized protein n=1 Tax=Liparis tanakae TaxID=230148 RepID=A0A4Z2F8R0_9TELE|nr:hypothetical protein EYF80_052221 [Liparis tanakae]